MARITKDASGHSVAELTELETVVLVLGGYAALLVALWLITRDRDTLNSIKDIATNEGVRLLYRGRDIN